jgi:hypothetical protein
MDPQGLSITQHASTRMKQRGIRSEAIAILAVVLHADHVRPCGDGCLELSLSRRSVAAHGLAGFHHDASEQATRIRVIEGADGKIVTVYQPRRKRLQSGRNRRH